MTTQRAKAANLLRDGNKHERSKGAQILGRMSTPRKTQAARRNGRLGGRKKQS